MNPSNIQTVLKELSRKNPNLLFKEFIEDYFKENRQLLLVLFHVKLNQAILYIPKQELHQPYVTSKGLLACMEEIQNMISNKEIVVTEVPEVTEQDIVMYSNLLKIDKVEAHKIIFTKGFYMDDPTEIKYESGETAYNGIFLSIELCKYLKDVLDKEIQLATTIIEPEKTENNTSVSIPKKETETKVEAEKTQNSAKEIIEKTLDSKETVFNLPKKKYKLILGILIALCVLVCSLIAFSFIHISLHHSNENEAVVMSQEETSKDTRKTTPQNTTKQNYKDKQIQYGIDISHYNGDVVSLLNSKDSLHFVICKATQGDYYVDPNFKSNWELLKDKGIIRGAYHFYDETMDPIAQANHFINVIGTLNDHDISPILDIEELSLNSDDITAKKKLQNNLIAFLQQVALKTKRKPIIYVDMSFANSYLLNEKFKKYRLYLASWTNASFPTLPLTWEERGLFLWQKSNTYQIGATKDDLDIFFGTQEQLVAN